MSVSDRSLLRLFVHCRERKFVQVARPTDSIGELTLGIESKFLKLYAGDEIKATRLQCSDGFDLDADDLVTDVFQDRDHVYVDLNGSTESSSPVKRSCFRSPAAKTPQNARVGQSGGSPIIQKITPVSSLPFVPEFSRNAASKADEEPSSKNDSPVDVAPSKGATAASDADANVLAQTVHNLDAVALKSKEAADVSIKASPTSAHRSKKSSKSKKQEPEKLTPAEKASSADIEPAESVAAVPGNSPDHAVDTAVPIAAEKAQAKSKRNKRQKKKASSEVKEPAEPEPKTVDELNNTAEEADDSPNQVLEVVDNESIPKKAEDDGQEEMTTCKKCNETMSKKSLKAHHRLHYEFACKQCSKKYGSEKGLEAHIKKAH